nr:4.8 kDa non-structural protein [Bovine coronavirus]
MQMVITIDDTDYTNIKPITVFTTVYLGVFIGIDTSTTGFTCFSRY